MGLRQRAPHPAGGTRHDKRLALVPGTRVGPYEILSTLGAGGMGEVYRARDTKLNRDVALKFLPDAFASDPDRLARFQLGASTSARMTSPRTFNGS